MNKTVKIITIALVLAIIGTLGYKVGSKINQKKTAAENVKTLPAFSFKTLADKAFTNANLQPGKPLIFIFFGTQCDYCHYEVRELKKNIDKFTDYQVCMVCSDPKAEVVDFVKVYDLDKYPQLQILLDADSKEFKYFGIASVPAMFIYNTDRKLVKEFKGEVKMEAILDAVKK